MIRRLDLMLVDDEPADVALFARALRKTALDVSLQILTAGQQAIDYLEAKDRYGDRAHYPLPDVIVLDLKMPGLNGFDFLAWRKASMLFRTIPVVVLSGSTDPAEMDRVLTLGADMHLVKPTHLEDWESTVLKIYDYTTAGTAFFHEKRVRQKQVHQT
jgi:CheY-like chemotaxis protein